MPTAKAQQYFVIPLSVQKEGEVYLVGNSEMGDFYQFPEQGLSILNMLRAGDTASVIRARLAAKNPETVDVDDFVSQLLAIGFIYPEERRQSVQEGLLATKQDPRKTFSVDSRIANAIFSWPVLACSAAIVLYTVVGAIYAPELRINFNAFYIETNRTALLLVVLMLSVVQVAMHELGHMLAAARHGIKSKYGIGNRLWAIVAESDLTGLLTLPKSYRYFPMLAGLLVDVLCASLLTILVQVLLQYDANRFVIQVVQALVLEILVSIPWQLNIFIKTDIYFVLCNYFGHPDLDRDARIYLRSLVYRATLGLLGSEAAARGFQNLHVLRVFTLIWLFGRILSLLVLFGVFLPTIAKYIISGVHLLNGPATSIWIACDTIAYAAITLAMLSVGMYMWLRQMIHNNRTEEKINASASASAI